MKLHKVLFLTLPLLLSSCSTNGQTILGFELEDALIPVSEIKRGGPPPDGIPSIDNPRFTSAGAVDYLRDDAIVLGLVHNGTARAYPFRILIWHEIVNDVVAGKPVAVTYCPLCGTAMVFDRRYQGHTLDFGVSGLLYNSDVLMFDRQTRSLWSQLGLKSVSGHFAGTDLTWLHSEQMSWQAWVEQYPESEVLNMDTGHRRDYFNLPYENYFNSPSVMFPVERKRRDLADKDWIAGIRLERAEKAYPLEQIPTGQWIEDTIGDEPVTFHYNSTSNHFSIRNSTGEEIPVVHSFWFAWQAFYPETELWKE